MRKSGTLLGATAMALAAASGLPQAQAAAPTGPDRAAEAVAAAKSHPAVTRFGAAQAFRSDGKIVDSDGGTHVRLERTYRGLDVLGGDLVVHQTASGAWEGSSQTLDRELSLSVIPAVAAATAAKRATAPSKVTRGIRNQRVAFSDLVVDATATPRLAWRVLSGGVQVDGTPSRLASYVDARTGEVIRTAQEIVNVKGSGQSLYGGTVPLQLTRSQSSYQLKDPTRGNTHTTDMNNRSDSWICQLFGWGCSKGTLFTSSDNLFGNGSASSRESAAVDAQYGTDTTWDYFERVHGRNGIFGNGAGSYNRVHYGNKYANAFWDGTKMTYGDGDGVNYGPLTSLDVAGHEMTHGVTENTAGLTYSGEPGGLNEATSDIFGTLVESYAANRDDPADYLIGEEFDLKNQHGLRRMDNPSSDGRSLNCWSPTAGSADVHYSSGIANHFFYLLAEGSGSKTIGGVAHDSTTCNGAKISGIGRDDAGKIWYRALTVYMTSSTSYKGARAATLNAAKDLHGAGSTQYNAVAAAWSAVSVS